MPPDDPKDPIDTTESPDDSQDRIQTEQRPVVHVDEAERKESLRGRETVVLQRIKESDIEEEPGEDPDEDDDHVTTAEAAKALSEVGLEILEPVGTILEDQATRVEQVRAFIRDLDSQYLRVLLGLHIMAAFILLGTVLWYDVIDPIMWFLMEFLVGIAVLRYVRAAVEERRLGRWIRGLTTALLCFLWAYFVANRAGPEPRWDDPELALRGELKTFWVAAGIHGLVAIAIILHLLLNRFLQRPKRRE
ncbi:MAG: hypothetical protein CMH54_12290 [Myxococcales bacterium]|nr:hypothetical protein [Myxococcales bacterium]